MTWAQVGPLGPVFNISGITPAIAKCARALEMLVAFDRARPSTPLSQPLRDIFERRDELLRLDIDHKSQVLDLGEGTSGVRG